MPPIISPPLLTLLMAAFFAVIFGIAWYIGKSPHREATWSRNSIVYVLILGIYCTSWTYYGVVGSAARNGFAFLTTYLGATFTFLLGHGLIRRLVAKKNLHKISNVADLISYKYGHSASLGALVTIISIIGVLPYIALQLKSIDTGFHELSGGTEMIYDIAMMTMLIASIIIFGLRKLDPTERHPRFMFALAIFSILKLVILLGAGVLLCQSLGDGFHGVIGRMNSIQWNPIPHSQDRITTLYSWFCGLALSAAAVLFLPHQYHVAVVECSNLKHVNRARWGFPLLLFLATVTVIPITLLGLSSGLPLKDADSFLLLLPGMAHMKGLEITIFLGGLAAAASMVMVESVALATMFSNHIALPILNRFTTSSELKRKLMLLRWALAALAIISGWAYYELLGSPDYPLAEMGQISFAAIFLFVPTLICALFFEGGTEAGAFAGLLGGFAVWLYTAFIPTFLQTTESGRQFLASGPFGVGVLRPYRLFGIDVLDPLSHSVFWSTLTNLSGLFLGSSWSRRRLEKFSPGGIEDQAFQTRLLDARVNLGPSTLIILGSEKKAKVSALFSQYFDPERAQRLTDKCFLKIKAADPELLSIVDLAELNREVEALLSGFIGAVAAHLATESAALISGEEQNALKEIYARLLSEMNISPTELKRKLDDYVEREKLITVQATLLQERLAERDQENEKKTEVIRDTNKKLEQSLTELHSTQSRLLETSKFTALGEMAGGIAHEVNTPLGTIKLLSSQIRDALEEEPCDVAFARKMTDRIDQTASRIAAIIRGLRQFSREGSQDPLLPVDIRTMINDTLSFCLGRFRQHGIALEFLMPEESMQVMGRGVQLSQVMLNLLNNSHDSIQELQDKWIKIEVTRNHGAIEIGITDSGPGIPQEIREKIFQPFFTTKAIGDGTGLGLSVSRGIIEFHQGSIRIDKECRNTRFIITLPLLALPPN